MTTTGRVLVALAAVVVSVLAVAAVRAEPRAGSASGGSTVNRTVSCTIDSSVEITANAKRPDIGAAAGVYSNRSVYLIGFDTAHDGFVLDSSACQPAKVKIPLTRSGLPLAGAYAAGDYTGFEGLCSFSGSVFVHMSLQLDGSGMPQAAKLAVWHQVKVKVKGRKHRVLKPLSFVQWSPAHTRAYLAAFCGG
jgi:hypothetical protein